VSERVLRVGVIGCGQIAQIMHLPYLHELPTFQIGAVCDISAARVDAVGRHYGVDRRFTDYRRLLDLPDLDAVLVTTRDHAPVAIAAANAGKHVMTEKPIAFNLADADAVIAAARANKVKLQVAYMKRYDPSYEWAVPVFRAMRDRRLIRVHALGGEFGINEQIYDLFPAPDLPASAGAEEAERARVSQLQAIGADRAAMLPAYNGLLHLCTHDATILRGAFGDPRGVLFADVYAGPFVVAVLDYGEGCRCVWESGYSRKTVPWDETLSAYGADQFVEVRFPFPYLHNGETVVNVRRMEDGAFVEKNVVASYDEAFKREWKAFHRCVVEDREPLTNGEEGRADVAMLIDVIRACRAAP
jgi:predicted dehydrogenase